METTNSYTIEAATVHTSSAWDQYVQTHPKASPYHRFGWIKSIEEAYGHHNVSLIAYESNKVVGILPCIKMQRILLNQYYCSLPYCDVGFCLADNQLIEQILLQKSLTLFQAKGPFIFDYRNTQEKPVDKDLTGKKVRMILPLPETSDALFAGFKSKLRSQIRKAEKNGLTYKIINNQIQIDSFYRIFALNMRKLGSPVHSKKWFESLFRNYQNKIVLSIVYLNELPIGAGIVLLNGHKASIPWASTVTKYNKLAPNMMLYWSVLKHVCNLEVKEFDFGRSTYAEGTYNFKRQWGAEPLPLLWSNIAQEGQDEMANTTSHLSRKRKLVEKIWSTLPLKITTSLGPLIRKHISL